MQGVIFTALADMVIEKFGLSVWQEALETVKPNSLGIYTDGQQYEDGELIAFVTFLSQKSGIAPTDLVRAFGQYLFNGLYRSLQPKFKEAKNLRDFLLSVDLVIHKEVKRLYPNSYLPKFNYDESNEHQLVMSYVSKRKLCHAAEGLILGAAEQFGQNVTISHDVCMHDGAEHCDLVVHFDESVDG